MQLPVGNTCFVREDTGTESAVPPSKPNSLRHRATNSVRGRIHGRIHALQVEEHTA